MYRVFKYYKGVFNWNKLQKSGLQTTKEWAINYKGVFNWITNEWATEWATNYKGVFNRNTKEWTTNYKGVDYKLQRSWLQTTKERTIHTYYKAVIGNTNNCTPRTGNHLQQPVTWCLFLHCTTDFLGKPQDESAEIVLFLSNHTVYVQYVCRKTIDIVKIQSYKRPFLFFSFALAPISNSVRTSLNSTSIA